MNIVQQLAAEEKARVLGERKIPEFQPGDTLRVNVRIKEGDRERIQAFEGVCIARDGTGVNETFTVRKISFAQRRLDRGEASRRRASRQAVLPARSSRQVGPDRRAPDGSSRQGRRGPRERFGRQGRRRSLISAFHPKKKARRMRRAFFFSRSDRGGWRRRADSAGCVSARASGRARPSPSHSSGAPSRAWWRRCARRAARARTSG
jgi:hypothetical protein